MSRFEDIKHDDKTVEYKAQLTEKVTFLESKINALVKDDNSRNNARYHLEMAHFWMIKGIENDQRSRHAMAVTEAPSAPVEAEALDPDVVPVKKTRAKKKVEEVQG